ncbi:MAG: hypothetical protein IPK87_11355 [Planctomycetes bacterium]|nr:hypothetical protein [Planctomycetota bacterium]
MRFKPLLFALPVTTALTLLALWAVFLPGKPPDIRLPESVRTDESRQPRAPLPESDPAATEPATPPAPEVVNDPRKGDLWLRLVDFDTRRPLANTACALCSVSAEFDWVDGEALDVGGVWVGSVETIAAEGSEPQRVLRTTDERGLFRQAARVDDRSYDDIPENEETPITDAAICTGQSHLTLLIPIPEIWWLWTDEREIAWSVASLAREPMSRPIDVFVRRSAAVSVSVIDQFGRAVSSSDVDYHVVGRPYWLRYGVDVTSERSLSANDVAREVGKISDGYWFNEYGARAPDGQPLAQRNSDANRAPRDSNHLDSGGTFRAAGLSPGRVLIVAATRGIGIGFADVILSPGSNRVEVMLEAKALSAVRVRVEARDEDLAEEQTIQVMASPAGPAGIECGFAYHWFSRWDVNQSAPGVWECVIVGLPSGRWWFEAGSWRTSGTNSVTVDVLPASEQSVTVLIGEGACATWTPMVYFAGKPLEEATVFLLGGEYESPEAFTAEHRLATDKFDPYTLMAGTYTAWAPGLDPVTFSLAPGEKRSDAFHIPTKQVTFSVGPKLTALLAPKRMELHLNLYCDNIWGSDQEHLESIDAQLRAANEQYDVLSPSASRVWLLPPGSYHWELVGDSESVTGRAALLSTRSESVLFEVDRTPGLCALEVVCEGFADDDLPDLEVDELPAMSLAAPDSYSGPVIVYPAELANGGLIETGPGRWTVLAPAGDLVVTLVTFGNPDVVRVAGCPGRLVVTREDFSPVDCELVITNRHGACSIDSAWGSTAGYLSLEVGTNRMRLGKVAIWAVRRGSDPPVWAWVELELLPGRTTLELGDLSYTECGTVTFTVSGRGGVSPGEDKWWFNGEEPSLGRIESLGTPRFAWRAWPGWLDVQPGLTQKFVYSNCQLPPGRYRVIPWEGAPEKFWVTFQVRAGEHTRVNVRGS